MDKGQRKTYPLNKTVYNSHIGPMILVPGQLPWDATKAYTCATPTVRMSTSWIIGWR